MRLLVFLLLILCCTFDVRVNALTIDGSQEENIALQSNALPAGQVVLKPSRDGSYLVPTLVVPTPESTSSDKHDTAKSSIDKENEISKANHDSKKHLENNFAVGAPAWDNTNRPHDNMYPQRTDVDIMVSNVAELPPHISYGGYYGHESSGKIRNCGVDGCVPNVKLHRNHAVKDLLHKAYDASSSGKANDALYYYLLAREKNPSNKVALFGVAFSYQMLSRHQEAVQVYVDMIQLGYRSSDVMNNLAVAVGAIDPSYAIKVLKSIDSELQEVPIIVAQMGVLHAKLGLYDKAQRYLMRAVYADGSNPLILYNLAVTCDKMSLSKQALRYYKLTLECLTQRKTRGQPLIDKAKLMLRIDQLSKLYKN